MYAAPFEYTRADSWAEAVDRVVAGGEDARVIAGGQSLAPIMMARMSVPSLLVDVNRAGPRTIERRDGVLALSALVRHVDLEGSRDVMAAFPALSEAAACIGNVRVRSRGTIGGSVAHSDPAAEYPCVAVAARATILALGPGGTRTVPAADMFVSHFTTALEPGEVVTEVEFPALGAREGCAFLELARRSGDFAMVEVCAFVGLDGDGRCAEARLVVGAIGERPVDVSQELGALRGAAPEQAAAEAARAAAAAVEIGPSSHASEGYRRELVAVLGRRALLAATARARGEKAPWTS